MTTLQGDWTGLLSFVSAVLLSTFILLLLPSSSVSLSNFYLAVPMRKCLGKYSCMSSPFSIAILNGTCSLRAPKLFCGDVPAIKTKLNKQTNHLVTGTTRPQLVKHSRLQMFDFQNIHQFLHIIRSELPSLIRSIREIRNYTRYKSVKILIIILSFYFNTR